MQLFDWSKYIDRKSIKHFDSLSAGQTSGRDDVIRTVRRFCSDRLAVAIRPSFELQRPKGTQKMQNFKLNTF